MERSLNMLHAEIKKQKERFGLEHDIEYHGSRGLAEVAVILASEVVPNSGAYEEHQWFMKLREKHKDNPTKRYVIAAAMLLAAIDCAVYEKGLST